MVFEAKNELKDYLSSINPVYAKYTECLWAKEVNSAVQLGNADVPGMHACGVENPIHAGDIIAQSKATGRWSYFRCSTNPVHSPASHPLHIAFEQSLQTVSLFCTSMQLLIGAS